LRIDAGSILLNSSPDAPGGCRDADGSEPMWQRIRTLLEMIRFSHTIFALPFALVSALLAWQEVPFRPVELLGILLCMVFARSAAMAFNRLADRTFDAQNPRTAQRHLPTGRLTPFTVWLFAGSCAAGFIASTCLFLPADNRWPLYLSVPVLLFIGIYSFTKRFTVLAHFWLGASLMLAPVAAWISIRGMEDLLTPFLLGLVVLFWVSGFDIIYACQDVDFDRANKLFSIPARWGVGAGLRVALVCHFLMLVALLVMGLINPHLGTTFFTGVAAVGLLLAYEHWLVRPDDLSRVNEAFFTINGIISIGLLAVVALQIAINATTHQANRRSKPAIEGVVAQIWGDKTKRSDVAHQGWPLNPIFSRSASGRRSNNRPCSARSRPCSARMRMISAICPSMRAKRSAFSRWYSEERRSNSA
jgi:4-hydroxybenzoate polyprenyltransferase